jgi:type VI secretion system secreted protein VgrG
MAGMGLDFSQVGRLIAIDTPLGEDKLLLERYTGTEAISRLFRFNADLLAVENVEFKDIVGQAVTITVRDPDGIKRFINGVISRFEFLEKRDRFYHFRAEIVPWLWKLTLAEDFRIFQNKNVLDVIKKVFEDLGCQDFKDTTQRTYDPRVYCTQYHETHFEFVSRLMEEEGIFYYFQHDNGKHTMVIADTRDATPPCPSQETARYENVQGTLEQEEDVVTAITMHQEVRTGKYSSTDYNFETPSTSLVTQSPTTVNLAVNSALEVFEYPGRYMKKDLGTSRTDIRMQEIESDHMVAIGASHCRAFLPGYRFELMQHPVDTFNTTYLLTEVNSRASVGTAYVESGDNRNADMGGYENSFSVIPYSTPYRPRRTTAKALVNGPHSALVVGPGGEEIYADKYGRVKVQFYWDRAGKSNEDSSCWCRVSQAWAGDKFGAMWIPRIGQEVIVDYLEGDPDQPVITGRLYNAANMPPYDLPDKSTVSTFKSRSSKGGGEDEFNEIRFEDKKGSEQLFMQAQKDMDLYVKKDMRLAIGADLHETVTNDQYTAVGNDVHYFVGNNRIEEVGNLAVTNVGDGGLIQMISGSYVSVVNGGIVIYSDKAIIIESAQQVSIKGPGGFVDVGPSGVTIQGTMVLINSGGSPAMGFRPPGQKPEKPDKADDSTKFTKS